MKKLLVFGLFTLCSLAVCAEEVKFVTLLSQPVGSFAKVELLDESKPAKIYHLNFCNKDAISGTINVAADCSSDEENCYPVDIEKLVVDSGNNATLSSTGGNAVKYYKAASSITIWSQANFTGGTLDVRAGNGNGGTGQADPNKVLVSTGSDGGSAAFRTDKIVANVASFNKMDLDDGTDKAFLKQTASQTGALISSGEAALSWQKIGVPTSYDEQDLWLLTNATQASSAACSSAADCPSGYVCTSGKCRPLSSESGTESLEWRCFNSSCSTAPFCIWTGGESCTSKGTTCCNSSAKKSCTCSAALVLNPSL